MNRIRIVLLVLAVCAPSLASAQALKFERRPVWIGASCGKDIDDNCRASI